jgi:hypothetical protein
MFPETRTRCAFDFGNRTTPRIQVQCSGLLALRPRLATGLPFRDRFLWRGLLSKTRTNGTEKEMGAALGRSHFTASIGD